MSVAPKSLGCFRRFSVISDAFYSISVCIRSAGTGRTGTFIAIDILLNILQQQGM